MGGVSGGNGEAGDSSEVDALNDKKYNRIQLKTSEGTQMPSKIECVPGCDSEAISVAKTRHTGVWRLWFQGPLTIKMQYKCIQNLIKKADAKKLRKILPKSVPK